MPSVSRLSRSLIRRTHRLPVLTLVFLFLGTRFLAAQESLDTSINAIVSQPHFKHAHWGALFVDQSSGDVVFARDVDKLFAPASTTKLYSVACALDAFGANHRFLTPVVRRGEIGETGELNGDLILIASGDLTLGGRTSKDGSIAYVNGDHTYANGNPDADLTEPDPLGGINELAKQVAAAGIKHVHGDVLIDDRLFDKAESSGSGPSRVTPVVINDNVIDIRVFPTQVGQTAEWNFRPQTVAIQIESKVVTVEPDKPLQISIREVAPNRISVFGQIPLNHKPILRIHEVHDPSSFARTLFIEALERADVSVDAPTYSETVAASLPAIGETNALPRVALLTSPPFSESAKLILKVSHNLHASTLPLLVASKYGERTLEAGLKRQQAFLKQAGVNVDTISFGGAAGGARADFVTPSATVQLLQYMAKRPDFPKYLEALPRLGVDGTLAKNVSEESPVRDKVQAKTGTLYSDNTMNGGMIMTSKALAGYMTTQKGRQLIFAVFVNNAHIRDGITTKTFGDDLGKICESVYLHE